MHLGPQTTEVAGGLRVGYINSQGLDAGNFRAFQQWIDEDKLDLLFVAETWYVGWYEYSRWKNTIAVTERPLVRPGSRYTGGLALFGTPRTQGRVSSPPVVSETYISVHLGDIQVSGVYFSPTLPAEKMEEALTEVRLSDLVLGDVNTRFGSRPGRGQPRERVEIFASWALANNLLPLLPTMRGHPPLRADLDTELTVDHCFVRPRKLNQELYLLKNSSLELRTDHRYTLYAILGLCPFRSFSHKGLSVPRFRVGRLHRPGIEYAFQQRWGQLSLPLMDQVPSSCVDVEWLNDAIVSLCQQVSEQVLGRVIKQPSADAQRRTRHRLGDICADQTAAGADRLVRQALASDRDNLPLLPVEPGADALLEVAAVLQQRYTAPTLSTQMQWSRATSSNFEDITVQEIAKEVAQQDGTKACGADGVHMRMIKALRQTSLLDLLAVLYNACWRQGKTPRAWNLTEIHLIIKDKGRPKTTDNVRPITLICMFRKVFEVLLLTRFADGVDGWARVHPAQAGFRRGYSTLTHAALIHALLDRKDINSAVFLDFRSAFDVVDHGLLAKVLHQKGCPRQILALIASLTFDDVKSRVFANGQISFWFPRTCGVLQGSPLSPYLFNLFMDGLLHLLNRGPQRLPRSLFYADDGVLLGAQGTRLQDLLDTVQLWCSEWRIGLNVKKCGYITQETAPVSLFIDGEEVPRVDEYKYLGFPVTADGIDFAAHLQRRIRAAIGRTQFFALYSSAWGPAHRLRVYRQYLAPMFEYGAPLAWAWSQAQPKSAKAFENGTQNWKTLVYWIAGGEYAWMISANLLGLPPLSARFCALHAAFQWSLALAESSNPLRRLLVASSIQQSFVIKLRISALFQRYKCSMPCQDSRKALGRFLLSYLGQEVKVAAQKRHLTAIVPFASRLKHGLPFADATLATSLETQRVLFQYRRGIWQFQNLHQCEYLDRHFHRGDDACPCFSSNLRIRRAEQRAYRLAQLDTSGVGLFTTVDYWLNTGQFDRALRHLHQVQAKLKRDFAWRKAQARGDGLRVSTANNVSNIDTPTDNTALFNKSVFVGDKTSTTENNVLDEYTQLNGETFYANNALPQDDSLVDNNALASDDNLFYDNSFLYEKTLYDDAFIQDNVSLYNEDLLDMEYSSF